MSRIAAFLRNQTSSKDPFQWTDPNRAYNRIIRGIILSGQDKGELRKDISYIELARICTMTHRGTQLEWCLANGSFSIKEYGMQAMRVVLEGFRPQTA